MIKFLRQSPVFNKFVRVILKNSAFDLTDKIRKYVVPRWRVAGNADIAVGDVRMKMFSDCDDNVVDALYYNASSYIEIEELKLFGELAVRSNFILDIGANTGFYSVFSAKKNPHAEIWAFEPYPSNSSRLKVNLSLNDLENVKIIEKAVGNEARTIKISVPQSGQICDSVSADAAFSNFFYRETVTYKEIEVDQIKLDDLDFRRHIDLIKIDVEHYELAVFEGAARVLEEMSPIIQCEIFVDEGRAEFYDKFLKPLGYKCYMMMKNGLLFCESLIPNPEGRDFLFTKREIKKTYVSYADAEELAKLLIP